jgi:predicted metal-binding membrane protein
MGAGGVLGIATTYQPTMLKTGCLVRCRSPFLFSDGVVGGAAVATGIRAGRSCVGCCWAPMAELFALGMMSPTWMALIAALVMVEKLVGGPARPRASGRLCRSRPPSVSHSSLAPCPGSSSLGSSAAPYAMKRWVNRPGTEACRQ